MTGGSYWAAHKTFIGHVRGVGVYNMSGGTAGFNFMHLGTTGTGGTVAGKGYLTITGGYIYSRTMEVGMAFDVAGWWGELNLIGGKWDFNRQQWPPGRAVGPGRPQGHCAGGQGLLRKTGCAPSTTSSTPNGPAAS